MVFQVYFFGERHKKGEDEGRKREKASGGKNKGSMGIVQSCVPCGELPKAKHQAMLMKPQPPEAGARLAAPAAAEQQKDFPQKKNRLPPKKPHMPRWPKVSRASRDSKGKDESSSLRATPREKTKAAAAKLPLPLRRAPPCPRPFRGGKASPHSTDTYPTRSTISCPCGPTHQSRNAFSVGLDSSGTASPMGAAVIA